MKKFNPHKRGRSNGPEGKVEEQIIKFLKDRGWFVQRLHGSTFQAGMPDLFCSHAKYGIRLVEVKDPNRTGDLFTRAQKKIFPQLIMHGAPVIILTGLDKYSYQNILLPNKSNFLKYHSFR